MHDLLTYAYIRIYVDTETSYIEAIYSNTEAICQRVMGRSIFISFPAARIVTVVWVPLIDLNT